MEEKDGGKFSTVLENCQFDVEKPSRKQREKEKMQYWV